MNDVLIDRDDYQKNLRLQQLRTELDAMGFHVVRKDWVRKFGILRTISEHDRYSPHANEIERRTRQYMGQELGMGILASGAMKFGHIDEIGFGRTFRAEVSIILRDPQFDKPEWAK